MEGAGAVFTRLSAGLDANRKEIFRVHTQAHPEGYDLDSFIVDEAMGITHELAGSIYAFTGNMSVDFLNLFIEQVARAGPRATLTEVISAALAMTIDKIYPSLSPEPYIPALDRYGGYVVDDMPVYRSLLLQPTGRYVSEEILYTAHDQGYQQCAGNIQGGGFATAAEITAARSLPVGYVLSIPPLPGRRLVQSQARQDDLPFHDLRATLHVELVAEEFDFCDPYIPGFRLLNRSEIGSVNRYGFMPEDGHDPYARAEIPLPAKSKQALAAQYDSLGLPALANALLATKGATVQDLVELIAAHSFHPYPKEAVTQSEMGSGKLPVYFNPQELADFAPLVQDGVLQAQYTAGANFIRLSLDALFGPGSAGTTSGYAFRTQGILTKGSNHAQATLVYKGKLHILDPYARAGDYLPSAENALTQQWSARYAPVQRLPRMPLLSSAEKTPEVRPQPKREEEIATLKRTLEAQLMIVTRAADSEELYKKIIKLKDEDPLRLTVETVLRANQKLPPLLAPEWLVSYVKHFPKNGLPGTPFYDASLLQLLQHTAERLRQLERSAVIPVDPSSAET